MIWIFRHRSGVCVRCVVLCERTRFLLSLLVFPFCVHLYTYILYYVYREAQSNERKHHCQDIFIYEYCELFTLRLYLNKVCVCVYIYKYVCNTQYIVRVCHIDTRIPCPFIHFFFSFCFIYVRARVLAMLVFVNGAASLNAHAVYNI